MYAHVPQAMLQFVLEKEKLSYIIGTAPTLEMARAYGLGIDFHRLIEAIDNNRLIPIDYTDFIDCLSMIDFHRLGSPGINQRRAKLFLIGLHGHAI